MKNEAVHNDKLKINGYARPEENLYKILEAKNHNFFN